jgi:hypothetical protein
MRAAVVQPTAERGVGQRLLVGRERLVERREGVGELFAPSAFACASAAYCFMSSTADTSRLSIRSRYRRPIVSPFSRIVSAKVFHCGSCAEVIFSWSCRYLMRCSTRASWRAARCSALGADAAGIEAGCGWLCAKAPAAAASIARVSEIFFMMGSPGWCRASGRGRASRIARY